MNLPLIGVGAFLCIVLVVPWEKKSTTYALNNPAVVAAVAPEYSMVAFQMQAQGEVIVEVKINSSGEVVRASMIQGHELLRAPSVQAARRWKFEPVSGSDPRVVRLTFNFLAFNKIQRSDASDAPVFYPPYKVEVSRNRPRIDT